VALNATGFSIIASDLTPKRLELLSEMVPQAKLFGLLVNPAEANPRGRADHFARKFQRYTSRCDHRRSGPSQFAHVLYGRIPQ
jgi:hypothetical protein